MLSWDVGGGEQQLSAVEPAPRRAGGDFAAAKHDDSIRHSNQFFGVVADQDDRHAGRRQLGNRTVYLRLRANINSARGLIQNEQLGVRDQVPSRLVLELTGASSGDMRLSDHAARSMI